MKPRIYKITNAGLYITGHTQTMGIKIMIGSPCTCGAVTLTEKQTFELLKILHIDCEDGGYLQDLLIDQYVLMGFDDEGYIRSVGDPFGNNAINLEGDA